MESQKSTTPKLPTQDACRRALLALTNDCDPSFDLDYSDPQTSAKNLTIEELERHAFVLENALIRIELETMTRRAALHEQRNLLLPVNSIPTELLVEVLKEIVSPDWQAPDAEHVDSGVETLHQIACVCKRWWQVVKGSPQLWTTIGPGPYTELKIRKSGTLPLSIRISQPETETVVRQFLSLVQTESYRWKSACVHFMGSEDAWEALSNPIRTPIMESFTVAFAPSTGITMLIPVCHFPSNIRHLHLRSITPEAWGTIPASLKSFKLSKVVDLWYDHHTKAISTLLTTCSWLQSLELDHICDDTPETKWIISPVTLHSLKKLVLRDVNLGILRPLLKAIRADTLATLIIAYNDDEEEAGARIFSRLMRSYGDRRSLLSMALHNSGADAVKIDIKDDTQLNLQATGTKEGCTVQIQLRRPSWCEFFDEAYAGPYAEYGYLPAYLPPTGMSNFPIEMPIHLSFSETWRRREYEPSEGMSFLWGMRSLVTLSLDCSSYCQIRALDEILSVPCWNKPGSQEPLPCPALAEVRLSCTDPAVRIRMDDDEDEDEDHWIRDAILKLNECRRKAFGSRSGVRVYNAAGELFDEEQKCFTSANV